MTLLGRDEIEATIESISRRRFAVLEFGDALKRRFGSPWIAVYTKRPARDRRGTEGPP